MSATLRRRAAAEFLALEILWERDVRRDEPLLPAEVLADQEDAAEARDEFGAFCRRMYRDYLESWHIAALVEALTWAVETPDARLIVTMPPRHSKSLHVSEHLPAWFLGKHPDRRVLAASHTYDLAKRFSRRVRNLIGHPRYPFEARVAGDSSALQAWDIAGRLGGYRALGVGGAPAGLGANLIVLDDPIKNAQAAESALQRQRVWDWFREDIYTRQEPGAAIILTATRWHADDLTGRLLEAMAAGGEPWRHLHLPAIAESGDALWPGRWPLPYLERRRQVMGSRAFEALYQGRPSAPVGGVLQRHWWRFWHRPGEPLPPVPVAGPRGTLVLCPCVPLPPTFDDSCQSWDMTFRKTETGSYVVGQVWGRTGADRYLVDQVRDRLDFPDALIAVQALSAAWPKVAAKLVENKANGPAVVASLRSRISGLIEVEPEGGKEARAHAAAAVAESGNVFLPHPSLAPWVHGFIDECADFPYGANDDQVDAFSQAMVRFGVGEEAVGFSYLAAPNGRHGANGLGTAVDAVGNDLPVWSR